MDAGGARDHQKADENADHYTNANTSAYFISHLITPAAYTRIRRADPQ